MKQIEDSPRTGPLAFLQLLHRFFSPSFLFTSPSAQQPLWLLQMGRALPHSTYPSGRLLKLSGLSSFAFKLVSLTYLSQMQAGKGKRRDTGRLCCQIPESCWVTKQKVTVIAACLARGIAQGCVHCCQQRKTWSWPALVGNSIHCLSRQNISSVCNPGVAGTSVFCAFPVQQVQAATPAARSEAVRCTQGMLWHL